MKLFHLRFCRVRAWVMIEPRTYAEHLKLRMGAVMWAAGDDDSGYDIAGH